MTDELCLLSVHAHPDDESSKGAGTVARYHAEGVHTVLVTCTGGEEGDILNPAMESPEVRANIHQVRLSELDQAVKIIGYDELELLGYRDSGMPEKPSNEHPECFAMAPLEEAVGKLVAIIRRVRPQVILTYNEEQQGYRHPDHLRVHEITVPAFELAGDANAYPEAGAPFQPLKLYYNAFNRGQFLARHNKYLELGLESPFEERMKTWLERQDKAAPTPPEPTTAIDLSGYELVRQDALLAHRTQIDPESKNWFGLPEHIERELHAHEYFVLAKSLVGPVGEETDLFAGVRELVAALTMAKWLSQEWLDESTRLAQGQPERPGASARLQYVISGGPDGEVRYYWVVVDGKLMENKLGTLDDAEVTMLETYDDALAMQKGELEATAAFMQGKIKVDGDVARLMALLPITMSPEFQQFQAEVLKMTEF